MDFSGERMSFPHLFVCLPYRVPSHFGDGMMRSGNGDLAGSPKEAIVSGKVRGLDTGHFGLFCELVLDETSCGWE